MLVQLSKFQGHVSDTLRDLVKLFITETNETTDS